MNFVSLLLKSSAASLLNSVVNIVQVIYIYASYDSVSVNKYLTFISVILTVDLICSLQLNSFISREKNVTSEFVRTCARFEQFNFLCAIPVVSSIVLLFSEDPYLLIICVMFFFRNIYAINGFLRREFAEYIFFNFLLLSTISKTFVVFFQLDIYFLLALYCLFDSLMVVVLNWFLKLRYDASLFGLPRFDLKIFKSVAKLNLHQLINLPFNQIDVVLLNFFYSPADVNNYKFARRVVGFSGRVVNPMNNLFLNYLIKGFLIDRTIFNVLAAMGALCFIIVTYFLINPIATIELTYKNVVINWASLVVGFFEILLILSSSLYILYLFRKRDGEYLKVVFLGNLAGLICIYFAAPLHVVFGTYAATIFFMGLLYARK